MTDLYLPSKIKVGYQKRNDCYSKKLAYVIYYDGKGKLRKETSWEGWRDKKITPHEFDNVPMSGFVLNRPVGGVKESYGWNTRNSYIRVYDPRGFEIEITLENLLFILEVYDSIKGKGLIGDFVYGWAGTELVLLPTETTDYKSSIESTELQNSNFSLKDLVIGRTYQFKDKSKCVYIGHEHVLSCSNPCYWSTDYWKNSQIDSDNKKHLSGYLNKEHTFYNVETDSFVFLNSGNSIANLYEETEYPDLANLYTKFYESDRSNHFDDTIVENDFSIFNKVKNKSVGSDVPIRDYARDKNYRITTKPIECSMNLNEKIDDKNFYSCSVVYEVSLRDGNSTSWYSSKYIDKITKTTVKREKIISFDNDNVVSTKNVPKKDQLTREYNGEIEDMENNFVSLAFKKGKKKYYI